MCGSKHGKKRKEKTQGRQPQTTQESGLFCYSGVKITTSQTMSTGLGKTVIPVIGEGANKKGKNS